MYASASQLLEEMCKPGPSLSEQQKSFAGACKPAYRGAHALDVARVVPLAHQQGRVHAAVCLAHTLLSSARARVGAAIVSVTAVVWMVECEEGGL